MTRQRTNTDWADGRILSSPTRHRTVQGFHLLVCHRDGVLENKWIWIVEMIGAEYDTHLTILMSEQEFDSSDDAQADCERQFANFLHSVLEHLG